MSTESRNALRLARYVVWVDYGLEGWSPTAFNSAEKVKEWILDGCTGSGFVITSPISIDLEEPAFPPAERLVDEVLRLEAALCHQASLAECAWCGELLPRDQAVAHVKSCAQRPPEAKDVTATDKAIRMLYAEAVDRALAAESALAEAREEAKRLRGALDRLVVVFITTGPEARKHPVMEVVNAALSGGKP